MSYVSENDRQISISVGELIFMGDMTIACDIAVGYKSANDVLARWSRQMLDHLDAMGAPDDAAVGDIEIDLTYSVEESLHLTVVFVLFSLAAPQVLAASHEVSESLIGKFAGQEVANAAEKIANAAQL